MSQPLPNYLTIEAVAERLGLRPETIRQWIRTGRVRAWRPGRRVLLLESDVVALVAASPIGSAHGGAS